MAQDPEQQFDNQMDQQYDDQQQGGGQQDHKQDDKMVKTDQFETNWDKVVESFDHMGLKEDLLRGIYAYGFEKPSAIQQRGILPVIQSLVEFLLLPKQPIHSNKTSKWTLFYFINLCF